MNNVHIKCTPGDYHSKEPTDHSGLHLTTTTQLPPLSRGPEQPTDQLPTIYPDTPELPIPEPDPCKSEYDAIASIRQEIFVFKVAYFFSPCSLLFLESISRQERIGL